MLGAVRRSDVGLRGPGRDEDVAARFDPAFGNGLPSQLVVGVVFLQRKPGNLRVPRFIAGTQTLVPHLDFQLVALRVKAVTKAGKRRFVDAVFRTGPKVPGIANSRSVRKIEVALHTLRHGELACWRFGKGRKALPVHRVAKL